MTIPAIIAALALLAGGFVLFPLARRKPYAASAIKQSEYDELREERDSAFGAISELESDLELGKLSQEDYRELYGRYRRQAVSALKATSEREAALSARIEQAVRETKLAQPSPVAARSDTLASAQAAQPAPTATGSPAVPRGVRRTPRTQRLSRRPVALFGALASIFVLLVAGTATVYVRGSRQAERATAVGDLGVDAAALVVNRVESNILLAATVGGLRQSVDGGATWTEGTTPEGAVSSVAQQPDGTLYALIEGAPFRSPDGGATWTATGEAPARLEVLGSAESGLLVGTDGAGTAYGSTDAGETWKPVNIEKGPSFTTLALATGEPLTLFGAGPGTGILFNEEGRWGSANGVINGKLPTDSVRALAFDAASGEGDPRPNGGKAAGTLYAATDLGVFRSTDYGGSWSRTGLDKDTTAVAVLPGTQLIYATGGDGKVYRSTNRGVSWEG